jgi:hypothetical protein
MTFSRNGNKWSSIESKNIGIAVIKYQRVLVKCYINPRIRCTHAKNTNSILPTYLNKSEKLIVAKNY